MIRPTSSCAALPGETGIAPLLARFDGIRAYFGGGRRVDLAGSQVAAGVAATVQADFDLRKNGTRVGTISFAASATVATFSAASAVAGAAGDVLTVVAPAAPEASLASVRLSLLGGFS